MTYNTVPNNVVIFQNDTNCLSRKYEKYLAPVFFIPDHQIWKTFI